MKRSNKISVAAFVAYGGAWIVGSFGATGTSKVLVVVAALLFLTVIAGYLSTGVRVLFSVLRGDRVISEEASARGSARTRKVGGAPQWQTDFVSMQSGVPNDIELSASDGINNH